ncbi:hypothetical protein [Candidatus Amarolinea dominans]|uniref:hypothetical protein n=1 Tax=Candidatus Amarolinea dominans TaxID=3140696 RepID=UPI0031350D57|nr:hypothetical protein [Anaerolineae bacterium]
MVSDAGGHTQRNDHGHAIRPACRLRSLSLQSSGQRDHTNVDNAGQATYVGQAMYVNGIDATGQAMYVGQAMASQLLAQVGDGGGDLKHLRRLSAQPGMAPKMFPPASGTAAGGIICWSPAITAQTVLIGANFLKQITVTAGEPALAPGFEPPNFSPPQFISGTIKSLILIKFFLAIG